MKNNLIVSDTNIFLDLYDSNFLKDFFSLPYKISTTMFVFSEIKDDKQLQALKPFIDSGKLKIEQLTDDEFSNCLNLSLTTPGDLSITDCSVWQKAKSENARLLTNDRKLRKAAEQDNVEVHGILYIFEELTNHNLIPVEKVEKTLRKLISINNRFPKKEAEKLIEKLNQSKKTVKKLKSPDDDSGQGI